VKVEVETQGSETGELAALRSGMEEHIERIFGGTAFVPCIHIEKTSVYGSSTFYDVYVKDKFVPMGVSLTVLGHIQQFLQELGYKAYWIQPHKDGLIVKIHDRGHRD